jgi:hypothetical protein
VKCYIDNSVCLRSCIRNVNTDIKLKLCDLQPLVSLDGYLFLMKEGGSTSVYIDIYNESNKISTGV